MSEQLRTATQTRCTPLEIYEALRGAWKPLVGAEPERGQLLVLLAQGAFETGWWHYCWNFNLGNAKHRAGDGRDYCQVRLNEVIGGHVVWFDPPNPATWLRAFDSLAAGVVDYLTLLRGQFGYAWPAVDAMDPAGFCHALRARGYYTDDEEHYTANVVGCYHQMDLVIPSDPEPVAALHPEIVPPDEGQPTPPGDLDAPS